MADEYTHNDVSNAVKRHVSLAQLSRDHHHALIMAQKLRRATDETAPETREDLNAFWEAHGQEHFQVEEEVLLPGFAEYGDANHPLVAAALCDHVAIRAQVQVLTGRPITTPAALHALGMRLRAHVQMEERELFPMIEASVPPNRLAVLALALDRA